MAISGVNSKCYILSLFIRDDGERFVLGDGYYEFKDNQLHFQANTIANDIVEVQGNDGYLLAGQVRRPGTQSFDGYVADGTTTKEETEEKRRAFFAFFRKNYFYKVVYVFADGTAIQRKRGFLVDDPTVSELYQQYPEYHVALNFEDVNYYSYSENDDGEEIFAKEALVYLSEGATSGGLVWDEVGVEWDEVDGELSRLVTVSGKNLSVNNVNTSPTAIQDLKIKGDIFQQTYSGKNLWYYEDGTQSGSGLTWVRDGNTITVSGTATGTSSAGSPFITLDTPLPAGTYTMSIESALPYRIEFVLQDTSGTNHFPNVPANSRSFTVTTNYDIAKIRIGAGGWQSGSTVNFTIKNMQFEAGSEATDFEPYVGGHPAPNPEYPQDITVVTGEQIIATAGKNLMPYDVVDLTNARSMALPNLTYGVGTYTISFDLDSFTMGTNTTLPLNMQIFTADGSPIKDPVIIRMDSSTELGRKSFTYTVDKTVGPSSRANIRIGQTAWDNGGRAKISNVQIEAGSTATDYEPYVGQNYTVSLGNVELYKVGDYQDYIYKSGNDWYVHKEVGIAMLGDMNWRNDVTNQSGKYRMLSEGISGLFVAPSANNVALVGASTYFRAVRADSIGTWGCNEGISGNTAGTAIHIYNEQFNTNSSASAFKTWLSDNNVELYYALKNPTDTQITDTTLIGQLEDLEDMMLAVGQNTIITISTGLNTEVGFAYRENALLSGGAIWEEGSGGGPTVVEVDSIDKVYPIWTVTGPAVNPQLSVLSTNTTLRYSGTVTESQALVIDMFNKTALLNGTSVIGNVSGDWVNFAPGNNRVVYTTNNADANPSKIQWQEVVG